MSSHTLSDDFQHFLSYSNYSGLSEEEIARLRKAYEHGASRGKAAFDPVPKMSGAPFSTKQIDWRALCLRLRDAVQAEGQAAQWGAGQKKARRELAAVWLEVEEAEKTSVVEPQRVLNGWFVCSFCKGVAPKGQHVCGDSYSEAVSRGQALCKHGYGPTCKQCQAETP